MNMHDHEDRELSRWLREVADADADAADGASPSVQKRLLEEVRALRRARRAAALKMYALAAGLVIATALPVWRLTTTPPSFEPSLRTTISATDAEVATVFYPLAYGTLPVTHGSIVRVEVSPAAFAALGVETMAGGSQRDLVLADVLVGEDGLARAVRFVRTAGQGPREQRP
jgi:hypothetical protein